MTNTAQGATVSLPSDREVRIERIFDAPRDNVWRAFTEPELIAQWWGRGRTTTVERMEVKRGGYWRFVMPDNKGRPVGFEGRYREVTPKDRLVYTLEFDLMPGYPVVETVDFIDLGDGRTRLVSVTMTFTKDERDGFMQSGMEEGLRDSYGALDRLLETLR